MLHNYLKVLQSRFLLKKTLKNSLGNFRHIYTEQSLNFKSGYDKQDSILGKLDDGY